MMRRAIAGMFVATLVLVMAFVVSPPSDAAPSLPARLTTFAAADSCPKHTLLGIFVPWFQYLEVEKDATNSCQVKDFNLLPQAGNPSDVPAILLAIVDDMLRLAGLAAVVFVIYGGIMYATSQGNPEATAKAQSTVVNALIGLVIAMIAIIFVSYVGKAVGV